VAKLRRDYLGAVAPEPKEPKPSRPGTRERHAGERAGKTSRGTSERAAASSRSHAGERSAGPARGHVATRTTGASRDSRGAAPKRAKPGRKSSRRV
jgi:hypothetical protein